MLTEDETREAAVKATLYGHGQAINQSLGIGRIGLARHHRRRKRRVYHIDAITDQRLVANNYDVVSVRCIGDRTAQFRTDAGGLAGSHSQWTG